MATDLRAGVARQTDDWTPARIFLAVSAGFHFLVGLGGLAVDQTFPIGSDDAAHAGSGQVFGILETNGWHSTAALLVAVYSLYFALRHERAREAAIALGIAHVGIFLGLAIGSPSTFWLASNAADQAVHASTAIGGIGSALLTRSTRFLTT